MTRDEFRKTATRMFKNVADPNFILDTKSCKGVHCVDCPIFIATNTTSDECMVNNCSIFEAFDVIEAVEQWTKEHPVLTNADKFKEVWGCELTPTLGCLPCPKRFGFTGCRYSNMADTLISEDVCNECTNAFWSAEYKAPKKEDNTDE